uniref:TOG domain-containing protein n=1 Tax=Macrostomum lignano TaxID=282301 RepID=A0A1I8FAB9_9PLAT
MPSQPDQLPQPRFSLSFFKLGPKLRKIMRHLYSLFGETNGRGAPQFFLEGSSANLALAKISCPNCTTGPLYNMRLVGRLATETLTSQQSRVQAASLERVRMAFPPGIAVPTTAVDLPSHALQCRTRTPKRFVAEASSFNTREAKVCLICRQMPVSSPLVSRAPVSAGRDELLHPAGCSGYSESHWDFICCVGPLGLSRALWLLLLLPPLLVAGTVKLIKGLRIEIIKQQQPAYQLPSYQADPFSADDYQQLMMQPQPQQQSLQSGDLLLADIVRELSGARNQRHEQRKFCMQRLIGLVRDKTALNWDDHFKNILLILLETLSENESDIRACALSALQELLRAESARFVDFVEVTVLKVLEAHRDQDRSVAKAADDCAKALSACLPADQILRVLIPIVLDSEVPITLAAIKMEMRVVQEADSGLLERLLAELCPGLVRACEHQESPIRKAAIFCLVQVQLKVGDSLMLHLGDMSGTKRRLLQLYICRARAPQQQQQQQLTAF